MIFTVSAGHNPANSVACGAVGLLNESTENRIMVMKVIGWLRQEGHTVYDCTCDNGTSRDDVLDKIIRKCNMQRADLHISIHFNAGAKDPNGNGVTTGTEVLVTGTNASAKTVATRVASKIAEVGFRNRGVKNYPDLRFLKETIGASILVEVCFVDDKDDVMKYTADRDLVAKKIAEGILGKEIAPSNNPLYRVQVGAYRDRSNAEKLVADLKSKGFSGYIIEK